MKRTQTKPRKLIGFDMNKTLINQGASWYDFNLSMGITPQEDEALYRLGPEMSGELDYPGWLNELQKLIISRGHGSIANINSVLQTYQLYPQAQKAIDLVNKSGNIPAIVTSGFQITAEKVAKDLGIKYVCFGTTIRFDKKGMLAQIESPPHDEHYKAEALEQIAKKLSICLDDTFYIADGDNDAETFKKVHGIIVKPLDVSIEDWKLKAIKTGEKFSSDKAYKYAYAANDLLEAVQSALSYDTNI
ncbi:HAD family hydrolase [Candidatus Saccharibacteria bacterium]|nr:HAD family hydrolase [Candidatus Saccharibacteria bacterium]